MFLNIFKKKKNVKIKCNNNKKDKINLLFNQEFEINECDIYKDNINKIVSISKEDMDLYDGLSSKEIREELEEFADEIGEIDSQETPEIKLITNETKTLRYISVKMYHKEFDKYLTIGKVPKEFEEQLLSLLNKNILIWGNFIGGKFKILDGGRIKTIQKPISVKLLVKIYEY